MKIRRVGTEFSIRTDGHMKPVVAVCNFANATESEAHFDESKHCSGQKIRRKATLWVDERKRSECILAENEAL